MNTHLLIIDPQNDFLDIDGAALPVPGANADMDRLGRFISINGRRIDDITVTLDSHPVVAVERVTFWQTGEGLPVSPFTLISADDVRVGKFVPREKTKKDAVIAMLEQLAASGKPGMMIWPVHCVTGTWGHNIGQSLSDWLGHWEIDRQKAVAKVLKGENPMTEHFGVFEADAPIEGDKKTQFNTELAQRLSQADTLYVAGEASSHCVAASIEQLLGYLNPGDSNLEIFLMVDCMSPVSGFEKQSRAFFEKVQAQGVKLTTSKDAGHLLQSIR